MEHLTGVMTRAESDAFLAVLRAPRERPDLGVWAIERPGALPFIGILMLKSPRFAAPFQPVVEIGWRLAAEQWGQGYASEAARAALAHGFDTVGLHEIVAFTIPVNLRSRRVMDRLGMRHDPADDFDHPGFPPGHRLCRHVLYRLTRAAWRTGA